MSLLPENKYQTILISLKEKIRMARRRASLKVNRELLGVYWEIGNVILTEQKEQGWGAKIIDKLAVDLKSEFPDLRGLSTRNLKYMRAFAESYPDFGIVQQEAAQIQNVENQGNAIVQGALAQTGENAQYEFVQGMLAQLSWYHHITLLDKVKMISRVILIVDFPLGALPQVLVQKTKILVKVLQLNFGKLLLLQNLYRF